MNCLQKCQWTVFNSVGELSSKTVSVNCLVGELSCSQTTLRPLIASTRYQSHAPTCNYCLSIGSSPNYPTIATKWPLSQFLEIAYGWLNSKSINKVGCAGKSAASHRFFCDEDDISLKLAYFHFCWWLYSFFNQNCHKTLIESNHRKTYCLFEQTFNRGFLYLGWVWYLVVSIPDRFLLFIW